MRLQYLCFAAYSVLFAINARAQATIVSAPERNYLLEVTQRWGADSFLGSLIERPMAAGDTELRVWGGYGLTGTTGVVMRRSGRRWQAWRVEVVRCTYEVPIPIADTASARTDSLFRRRARETCGGTLDSAAYGHSVYSLDTLVVDDVTGGDLDGVWRRALSAGVRQLPPRVPRTWMMLDGFSYVIELREGSAYRASVIEALDKPEVEADRQAREIYEAVERGVRKVVRRR